MCETIFDIKYDYNWLYCNNYFYKYKDSNNDIFQVNIHDIRKKHFLNYFTIPKYQILIVDKVLRDNFEGENTRPIFFVIKYSAQLI